MRLVNMLEAKSTLSRLVQAPEDGSETEIVIARNGRSAAKLVSLRPARLGQRIGLAKGHFLPPDDIDVENARIAALFAGSDE